LYYNKDGTPLSEAPVTAGKYYVEAYTEGSKNYNPLKSEKIEFTVIEVVPVSMAVVMKRVSFSAFDKVSPEDFTVELLNNDGSYAEIDISLITISYSSAESLRYSDTYITISYLGFSVNADVSVKKADYDMSSVRWSNTEFIYDGSEKSITLIGLPDGVSVIEYRGNGGTAAGSYNVTAVLSYDAVNCNPPTMSEGNFVIRKCTLELPSLPSLTYNGEEQMPIIPESDLYTAEYSSGVNAGVYEVIFKVADPHNYVFSDLSSEAVSYYEISPRKITVQLSDIEKYRLSSMPKPHYTVIDGEIINGDELSLVFSYGDKEVLCVSDNLNYLLTVIPGKITRYNTLSEDTVFLLFIIFLIVLSVLLLIFLIIFRRRDIMHYVSIVRCRLSPVAKTAALPPEAEEISKGDELKSEAVDLTMSVDAEHADSLISDSLAKELVKREDVKIETDGTKKRIINVDTLSENFSSGDSIDVNKLKEMSLVPYDTAYVKILARGMIDKPLKVYANDFSLSAVKMIALTGGEAIRVITVRKKKGSGDVKGEKFPENS
jgi:ribosomal protein L18E